MLTIKTSLAVAILLGAATLSSIITYAVTRVSVTVDCELAAPAPAVRPWEPTPKLQTDDGKRY